MLVEKKLDEIPNNPGAWVKVRAVSGAGWRRAKRKRAEEARQDAASLMSVISPDIFDRITSRNEEVRSEAERQLEELEYHPDNVDHAILLTEGVVEWSFGKIPEGTDPSELIDNAATQFLVREIIALTRPPSQEAQGNSSRPSPATAGAKALAPTPGT